MEVRKRMAERFSSDDPESYVFCPKCSLQTIATNKGVACEICGPIEDLILASKENFDEFTPKTKAKAALKAPANLAGAKG